MASLIVNSGTLSNPASVLETQVMKEVVGGPSGFLDRVANRIWRVTSGLKVYSPFNISKTIPGEFPHLNCLSEWEKIELSAALNRIYGI